MKKKNIAIFASGSGTNAENIIRFFTDSEIAEVRLILSNNPEAGVLKRAELFNLKTCIFDRKKFYEDNYVLDILRENQTDLIILAGFLWLIPRNLIQEYPGRIINIHPALLPKFGGKGMYGKHVHQAVISSGDKETGITIHYVNEKYDEGSIIFQARCGVSPDDTPESLANKVHELEYKYYPPIIEKILRSLNPYN